MADRGGRQTRSISYRLIAAVLGLSALGAGAPLEGPERTVSDVSFGLENVRTDRARVAAGPGGFLAAWQSEAVGLFAGSIRVARLDAAGALVDDGGVTLVERSLSTVFLTGTALAAGNDEYLVAWIEMPTSPVILPTVQAALVDPTVTAGSPARAPLVIEEAAYFDGAPGAAFDPISGRYLVAFREDGWVLARWLDPADGSLSSTFAISSEASGPLLPEARIDVACSEEGCLVAYYDERPAGAMMLAAPVLGSGGAGPESVIATHPLGSGVSGPDVEVDEGGYLLTWVGENSTTLVAQRLTLEGAPRDPAPSTIPTVGAPVHVALARTGMQQHLLVWTESIATSAAVWGVALDTQAAVQPVAAPKLLNPIEFADSGQLGVACPGAPQACQVVHPASTFPMPLPVSPLVAFAVAPELGGPPVVPKLDLSERPAPHERPAAACSQAGECLAAWREPRLFGDVGGQVVAAALPLSSEDPLALGTLGPAFACGIAEIPSSPVIAAAPASAGASPRFLVGWFGWPPAQNAVNPAVIVAFVEEGVVKSTHQLSDSGSSLVAGPAIAAGGERFLIAWLSDEPEGVRLHAARVGVDGSLPEALGAGLTLPVQADLAIPPAVTWDGEAFLIVWQGTTGVTAADLHGLRVTASGASLQALGDPFAITELLQEINFSGAALASEGGGISLVVWQEQLSLRAVRVGPGGVRLGEPVVIASGPLVGAPRAVFDGDTYLVTWIDGVEGSAAARGAWIAPNGEVLTPGGFPLAEIEPTAGPPPHLRDLAVGSDGAGRTLMTLVRDRFEDDGLYIDPDRVRARLLGNPCALEDPAITCAAEGCLTAGFCDPNTRTCADQVPRADGTPCEGGLCVAGTCVADLSPGEGGGGGLGPGSAPPAGENPGGCGCRAAGAGSRGLPAAVAALALLALRARKRKR